MKLGELILDFLPKCALIYDMKFMLKNIIGVIGKVKISNSSRAKLLLHNLYVSTFVGRLHSISSGSTSLDGFIQEELIIYTLGQLVANLHRMKSDDDLS